METLRVGAAFPDPPFNGMPDNTGLDIDLMTAIAESLGATVEFIPCEGNDFNGIFDGLGSAYDCVTAGTTVTPDREKKAKFIPPYLISGQSLAVDTTRLPHVRSVDDLEGLTIGVQADNTSQPIAERLVAEGKAAAVRVYEYGTIRSALTDLATGACDAFMKLAPVLTELVKPPSPASRSCSGGSPSRTSPSRYRWETTVFSAISRPLRKPSSRTGRCNGYDGNRWVIRTPTSRWVCTNQPARGEYHTTRLSVEHQGKKGRHK
jgi:ABC-type amino acid transport substrate-binding protein